MFERAGKISVLGSSKIFKYIFGLWSIYENFLIMWVGF